MSSDLLVLCLDIGRLLREIEEYRLKMYELANKKNLTDPEVINISQRLDQLLNKYNTYRYKVPY